MTFLRRHSTALLWALFALVPVAFYSIPLFSRNATIHWDLADVTYPAQKFLSDSLRSWKLPHWTPYLDSGIPFLADPRTGAWYPLHWPFFAIGITPRIMVWELALHMFIAMSGAYLLARFLFNRRGPAILGAMFYSGGGFFAAHSTWLGQFEAGALLPWLLWAALQALESGQLRWTAIASLTGGLIVLAGNSSAALESLVALICVVAACVVTATQAWKRALLAIASVTVIALMLGAVQMLPAIQLHSQSHPAPSAARFQIGGLATVVAADYYSLISGLYSGPDDPRQYYLYSGLLVAPLALAGFVRRERWMLLLAMIAPTAIFDAALRPPGDAWFPAALGLAMTAASGAIWIEHRLERPHVWVALCALTAIDLWFWNVYKNPLVFAHATFAEVYGQSPADLDKRPFARTWAPYVPVGLGPADGSLITRTEVAYGTGLAEMDRYTAYLANIQKNPKLLNGLGVTDLLLGRNKRSENPESLGRISAPPQVEFVPNRNAALSALTTLDPAKIAIIEGPAQNLSPSVQHAEIIGYTGDSYRVKYSASANSLLRIAVPYYPGWAAAVDGEETAIVPVDEALMGVLVPPGDHEVTLEFHAQRFLLGLSLSFAGVIAVVLSLILASDSSSNER